MAGALIALVLVVAFLIVIIVSGTRAREKELKRKEELRKSNGSIYGKVLLGMSDLNGNANNDEADNQNTSIEAKITRGLEGVNMGGSCPKCGSTQIQAMKKGFSAGKAIVGGAVFGPVGLAGGAIGANKVQLVCLRCGEKF